MGQQRKPGVPTGLCKVCNHPDVGRINFLLIATKGELGGGRKSLSEKFGLSEASLHRHRHNHIPKSFIDAVRVGPLESVERLQRLAAEENTSVLERFNGLYNGHLSRWLWCFEAGNDDAMAKHGRLMGDMLAKIALLTRELLPAGSTINNNLYMSADFTSFQAKAVQILRRHPEALADWLAEFAPKPEPKLIEAQSND